MAKQAKQAADTDETSDQIARDGFRAALISIRNEIRAIGSGDKKPAKHTPTETIAYLAKQMASIQAELRKTDAADHKRSSLITKALVIDWYRQLEPAEQAQFARELQQLTTKRSGLA